MCSFESVVSGETLTLSEYSTTSRIERGNPDIRYALAAGAIFISNINTSVTIFDDNCEKSCISVAGRSGENSNWNFAVNIRFNHIPLLITC